MEIHAGAWSSCDADLHTRYTTTYTEFSNHGKNYKNGKIHSLGRILVFGVMVGTFSEEQKIQKDRK